KPMADPGRPEGRDDQVGVVHGGFRRVLADGEGGPEDLPHSCGPGPARRQFEGPLPRLHPKSGLPDFDTSKWPKSDKSDFGWRDREGEAPCSVREASPSPPSPASGGGSESQHPPKTPVSSMPNGRGNTPIGIFCHLW